MSLHTVKTAVTISMINCDAKRAALAAIAALEERDRQTLEVLGALIDLFDRSACPDIADELEKLIPMFE